MNLDSFAPQSVLEVVSTLTAERGRVEAIEVIDSMVKEPGSLPDFRAISTASVKLLEVDSELSRVITAFSEDAVEDPRLFIRQLLPATEPDFDIDPTGWQKALRNQIDNERCNNGVTVILRAIAATDRSPIYEELYSLMFPILGSLQSQAALDEIVRATASKDSSLRGLAISVLVGNESESARAAMFRGLLEDGTLTPALLAIGGRRWTGEELSNSFSALSLQRGRDWREEVFCRLVCSMDGSPDGLLRRNLVMGLINRKLTPVTEVLLESFDRERKYGTFIEGNRGEWKRQERWINTVASLLKDLADDDSSFYVNELYNYLWHNHPVMHQRAAVAIACISRDPENSLKEFKFILDTELVMSKHNRTTRLGVGDCYSKAVVNCCIRALREKLPAELDRVVTALDLEQAPHMKRHVSEALV